MTRLGLAVDELVQERHLSLLLVDLRAHVHGPNVRVVGKVVRQRPVVSLGAQTNIRSARDARGRRKDQIHGKEAQGKTLGGEMICRDATSSGRQRKS